MANIGSSVEVLDVSWYGDLGKGTDTATFQAAVNDVSNRGESVGYLFVPEGSHDVSLMGLAYGTTSVQWVFAQGASTTDVTAPAAWAATGGNGSTANVSVSPADSTQIDVFRVYGENTATGDGSLVAYHFDLEADSTDTSTDNQAVRGILGAVRNSTTGRGSIKGLNVTAVDSNTTNGATALMCFESSLNANAQTSGARIYSGSLASGSADNVSEAMVLTANGVAWKSGIRFASAALGSGSGDNPAFFQAQLASGGASDSWFTKWLNNAGTIIAGIKGTGVAFVQRLKVGNSSTGPEIFTSSGSPEGVLSAVRGSIYLNTNGADEVGEYAIYIKRTGAGGNTGWEGVGTVGS